MRRRVSEEEILRGRRILVIASTPKHDVLEAEEALAGIIRAVIAEGGTIDLVADDSLTLFGATVAGEYFEPRPAEAVDRPRSERERNEVDEPSIRMHPTSTSDDVLEIFANAGQIGAIDSAAPFEVITRVAEGSAAMICIGDAPFGEYVGAFRQRSRAPIYTFALSGRAAHDIAERSDIVAMDVAVAEVEPPRSSRRELDRFDRERSDDRDVEHDQPVDFEFQFPPMVLAAQLIVRAIAERNERGAR